MGKVMEQLGIADAMAKKVILKPALDGGVQLVAAGQAEIGIYPASKSAMTKLAKNGKGIILMHDFQHSTAEAMPELLGEPKAGGYESVHMVPKQPVVTLAKYDDMVQAQDKFSAANNTRPESSVVKTVGE
jgi:hypothetical protein